MWTPDEPLCELPAKIRRYYREHAEYLYYDLKENKLKIGLKPAPIPKYAGHKVHIVETWNPQWYSDLYWSRSSFRRDLSLRALERIKDQRDRPFIIAPYKYDAIYRELIHKHLLEGYDDKDGRSMPPNYKVKSFFDLEATVDSSVDVSF